MSLINDIENLVDDALAEKDTIIDDLHDKIEDLKEEIENLESRIRELEDEREEYLYVPDFAEESKKDDTYTIN